MHEKQMHSSSAFVTLTYSDEEIPANGTLEPEHFRAFVKRIRKREERKKAGRRLSYFACGEYGETTERPHYHAVLFGPQLDRTTIDAFWNRGITDVGTLTMASASYVAGYVRKKVSLTRDPDHYLRVDRETGELFKLRQEFARMSLRPAIGRTWIEKFWRDVYPRDFVVVDGREAKPPRYYDKWMDREHPDIMEEVRQRRFDEAVELDEYQLNAKKKIAESRNDLYQKRNKL